MLNKPLAERMRPKNLTDFVGQEKLVGERGILKKSIESGQIPSMILWGPPGVGKTTLALIIANTLKRPFIQLSAINSGVKDIREAIQQAEKQQFFNKPNPILFIDEIHRFSKSQQDSLLGAVEKGTVTLIGATTENPSFEVISALLSRTQVYTLEGLNKEELSKMIHKAITEDEYLSRKEIQINEVEALIKYSGGDGRRLYNVMEIVINQFNHDDQLSIDNETVDKILSENMSLYDKSGEMHYDIISAFIKSIRGSDPNAAVYYLARMVEGGEDPLFICRRMIISASEDVGLANPNALLMANNCFQAVHQIGMPEGRIIMAQTAIYLASSPKSNSAYAAIRKAQSIVREMPNSSIPLHLRNAPTDLMKSLNYGANYKYAHDFEQNFVDQEFLPDELAGTNFYTAGKNQAESRIVERLKNYWKGKYDF
jgi:putative ATPase